MQRLTVSERLLLVALLPTLGLLARESFGPAGQAMSFWPVFSIAVAALSLGFALLVARSLSRPLRHAIDDLGPLAAGEGDPAKHARSETASLTALARPAREAACGRARLAADQDRLDRAERSARRANLSNMANEVEEATERGLRTVVDGSAVCAPRPTTCAGRWKPCMPPRTKPRRRLIIRAP